MISKGCLESLPPPTGSETSFVTKVEEVLFSSQIDTPAGALVHFVLRKGRHFFSSALGSK